VSEAIDAPAPRPSEPDSIFAAVRRASTVPLLVADPELAEELDETAAALARRALHARVVHFDPGPCDPGQRIDPVGAIGLLVTDGLICRSVIVGSEASSELLGAGDVLRPWADDASDAIPARVEYEVLAPAAVAILDRAFAQRLMRFPEVFGELTDRALRRARAQAVLNATCHIKRVDVRLLALFWHLAERWGRVTPRGIVVPLRLTHTRLAALVGAQRPSVTTALKRMHAREVLTRDPAGHYVLGASAHDELERLCLSSDARHLRLVHSD
jgi:CRP/FNR family transcriptional regulator, cyclic AMP receptor protein